MVPLVILYMEPYSSLYRRKDCKGEERFACNKKILDDEPVGYNPQSMQAREKERVLFFQEIDYVRL